MEKEIYSNANKAKDQNIIRVFITNFELEEIRFKERWEKEDEIKKMRQSCRIMNSDY